VPILRISLLAVVVNPYLSAQFFFCQRIGHERLHTLFSGQGEKMMFFTEKAFFFIGAGLL